MNLDQAVESFEITISEHDWRNGRQTRNIHIDGKGMSQGEFEKLLERIAPTLKGATI